jgi:hypothetical protein
VAEVQLLPAVSIFLGQPTPSFGTEQQNEP